MRKLGMLAAALTLGSAVSAATAADADKVEMKEWPVPWTDTRPRDPFYVDNQTVWFAGQEGDYLAMLNPESGEFKQHKLVDGAGPHNVIVNDEGVWYSGNRAAHIGLLDPNSGSIETISLPGDGIRDVHTMDFTNDGNIWFTVQAGNQIGHLKTNGRDFTMHEIPSDRARPYGLMVDDKNRPWVTLFGTNKIATMRDDKIVEFTLPREDARPRRLALSNDGFVWYVDYAMGYLGRFDPDTESFKEWRLPGGEEARPFAVVTDNKHRPWFIETGTAPNRLVGFDPESQAFFATTEIGSGGETVRQMIYVPQTNEIWFGTDSDTIGRARLP